MARPNVPEDGTIRPKRVVNVQRYDISVPQIVQTETIIEQNLYLYLLLILFALPCSHPHSYSLPEKNLHEQ
jgi:hypothetical protein